MHLKVDSPVTVAFIYNSKNTEVKPILVRWDGRSYRITKIGLHHTFRTGRTLHHIFSVISDETFFRLNLDTDTLHWRLEEVSDGLSD